MPIRTATALAARIGNGPAHDGGADPSPQSTLTLLLGLQQAEVGGHNEYRRAQGERSGDDNEHADRDRDSHRGEPGQPGEDEAEGSPGDRQTRTQDDGRDTVKGRVVSGLSVFAGRACLLITSDEEDPVVGSGRDGQHRQQSRREYR